MCLEVAQYSTRNDLRAPESSAAQPEAGGVLLEDFGDARMRDWLDENPSGEQAAYEGAVDALVRLHDAPAGPFAPYDMAAYAREFGLFTEIGRAHVWTPVTNAHLVCRLLLEKKNTPTNYNDNTIQHTPT